MSRTMPSLPAKSTVVLAAADVELVHRGEIVWLEPVWILARRSERIEHNTLECPVRVVLRHCLFDRHDLPC